MDYSEDNARRQMLIGDPELSILKTYLDDSGGVGKDINNTLVAVFKLTPPTNQIYVIDTLDIIMETSGAINVLGFDSGLALPNGILLYVSREEGGSPPIQKLDLLDGLPITKNIHLYGLGKTEMVSDAGGSYMMTKVSYTKDSTPLRLEGRRGEYFALETQDAARMNAITFMRARVHYRIYNNDIYS